MKKKIKLIEIKKTISAYVRFLGSCFSSPLHSAGVRLQVMRYRIHLNPRGPLFIRRNFVAVTKDISTCAM